jgi:chemotaxis protein histidine kinase CheA
VPAEDILELDEEIIKDFLDEFTDAYEDLQQVLVHIDQCPSNKELINQLFRIVHSIKSNLRMVALDRLSEIVHTLEDILDDVRHDRHVYAQGTSDIVLVVIAQVRELAVAQFRDEDNSDNMDHLYEVIHHLCMVEPDQLEQAIVGALKQVDPDGDYDLTADDDSMAVAAEEEKKENKAAAAQDIAIPEIKNSEDMSFFIELSQHIEDALPNWQGRNQRILDLCLKMNQLANNPVEANQLAAAVYLHDMGMSFVPNEILTKPAKLDCDEELILRNHCHLGYNWLNRIQGWGTAAIMVYQHHERFDGSGYPLGLKGDDILDGAKMIAIADTFEAMTNSRAYRQHKRPVMRAILEINSNAGAQFDTQWVEHFIQVIKNNSKSSS